MLCALAADPVARYPSIGSTASDPGGRPPLHGSHALRSSLRPCSAAFVPASAAAAPPVAAAAAGGVHTAAADLAAAAGADPQAASLLSHVRAGATDRLAAALASVCGPGGGSRGLPQTGSIVIDESLGLLADVGGAHAFDRPLAGGGPGDAGEAAAACSEGAAAPLTATLAPRGHRSVCVSCAADVTSAPGGRPLWECTAPVRCARPPA